jgi:demethylmenaquinone methyltransferase/2-methoxy-6-polyprenyl-1,4-benzoquinol methylase
MFDRIAPRYDLVNTLLTAGVDSTWRRAAAAATRLPPGGSAVDVACGSGRLTAELARLAGPTGRVVGVDFSEAMLSVARRQHAGLEFAWANALALPFGEGEFDAATMGFGLRNLDDPVGGLREMTRVARRAVVLEFVKPPAGRFGRAYRFYLRHVLPRVGGALSGDAPAYRYLSDTVESYRTAEELEALAAEAGWRRRQVTLLFGRTVAVMAGDSA